MQILKAQYLKKGIKIGNTFKTFTSPLHILLHEDVQILLFWNNSVDVPAFILYWKKLLHETFIIRCFTSSLKKYAHTLCSNFLLFPLLKCFRKEKHFVKNQLCPCLQPLLLNFVPLKCIKWLSSIEVYTFRDFVFISCVTSYWNTLKRYLSDHLIHLLEWKYKD